MNGKKFKRLLKLNGLTQEEAAQIFNVSRETINRWCGLGDEKVPQKVNKIVRSHFRIQDVDFSEKTLMNGNGVQISDSTTGNIDNRQYYSDSPDVLRAQIEVLDERIKEKDAQIKEKDAQIKEKDAQIKELLSIVRELSKS